MTTIVKIYETLSNIVKERNDLSIWLIDGNVIIYDVKHKQLFINDLMTTVNNNGEFELKVGVILYRGQISENIIIQAIIEGPCTDELIFEYRNYEQE